MRGQEREGEVKRGKERMREGERRSLGKQVKLNQTALVTFREQDCGKAGTLNNTIAVPLPV